MDCKYKLPCGTCELKNTLCAFEFPVVKETSNSLVSSDEYRKAIEFLKKIRALMVNGDIQHYYDLAIKALREERDKYFPGAFTKS